jgi:hypothetical protein
MTWMRVNKDAVRGAIFQHAAYTCGSPLKSYLCLPGKEEGSSEAGQCVRKGYDMKVLSAKTRIIGYESDPRLVAGIKRHFQDNPNVSIHKGFIEDSQLGPKSIDLAFLDFKGNMNSRVYIWLRETLVHAMTTNGVIAVTQPFGRQPNPFFAYVKKRLRTDLSSMREALIDQYGLWGKSGESRGKEYGKYELVVVGLAMVKCALREYHVRLADILRYHDGTNGIYMYAMIFDSITKRLTPPVYPELY